MPIRPPEYGRVTRALEPVLVGLPPRLVAIDGPFGVGKTTLGRYLAWFFNVTLVETDLFIASGPPLVYRNAEVAKIIEFRLGLPRPIIVEGANVLTLLGEISKEPSFLVSLRKASGSKRVPSATSGPPCPSLQIELSHGVA